MAVRMRVLLPAWVFLIAAAHAQTAATGDETPKPSITGTVTDETTNEPVRKVYLELTRGRTRDSASTVPVAISDAEGRFAFKDLEPGDYSISAQKPGYAAAFVRNLHVDSSQTAAAVRVAIIRLGSIGVRVVDPDGDPVPLPEVAFYRLLFRNGKRRLQVVEIFSGADSDLNTRVFEPGRYYIAGSMAMAPGRKMPVSYLPTWYPDSLDAASAAPVSLAPGQTISGLEIRLRPGATHKICGTVAGLLPLEANGRPYYVVARRQSSFAEDPSQPGSQVNAKGGFELTGLTPGPYEIDVSHADLSHAQYSIVRLSRATVQVGDQDLTNVTLQASAPRMLILRVRAESDTPVDLSHLNIILVSTDFSAHVRARELDGGQYEVSGLSAGEH